MHIRTLPVATATAPGVGDAVAPLLSVEQLQVDFATSRGTLRAVDGVSWSVAPGETLALVGESGCGKSVSALAILRLLTRPIGRISGGRIMFDGRNLLDLTEEEMREIRARTSPWCFRSR